MLTGSATSVGVFSDANTAVLTQQVGLTAVVDSTASGTPTGTVAFYAGSTLLGTGTVSSAGGQNLAVLSTTNLPLGTDDVTAVYSGDSNFAGSTSPGFDETVTQGTAALSVISSTNPVAPNGTLQLIPLANGVGGVAPTGTVSFVADGTTLLGQGTLTTTGTQGMTSVSVNLANLSTPLTTGQHTITAEYSGDSDFNSGDSPNDTLEVASSSSDTLTNLSASVTQAVYGQSFALTANVSSSAGVYPPGTVSFYMDGGSTPIGTATLTAYNNMWTASYSPGNLPVGNHTFTAVYSGGTSGGTTFPSSTSSGLALPIVDDSTITNVNTNISSPLAGQAVTLTATVNGGQVVPPGAVTFWDGSTNLGTAGLSAYNGIWSTSIVTSSLPAGNQSITAKYTGDGSGNYLTSTSAPLTLPVQAIPSTTSLTASSSSSPTGQWVTFTASVQSGESGSPTPTGTVTFTSGSTTLGTGTVSQVDGNSVATFSTNSLTAGSYSITATYNGDANFAGSASSALPHTITSNGLATGSPTSVEVFSDADTAVSTQQVGLSAIVSTTGTGTPTGTVTFFSGSTALGTVNVQSVSGQNLATLPTSSLPVGTDNVTAVYSGDSNFAGSTSPGFDEQVTQATTAISLISSTNPVAPGGELQLIAIANSFAGVNPTGTITFVATNTATEATTTLGPATLSLAGGQALATLNLPNTSLAAGTYTITAEYSGDSNFASGNSSGYTLQVASSSSATVTNLSATVTQAVYGQPQYTVALIANVSSSSAYPPGTVSFYMDGGTTPIGTATLTAYNGRWTATYYPSNLPMGNHTFTAVYSGGTAGGTTFPSSTSSGLPLNVIADPTITNVSTSVSQPLVGQQVVLTATVGGGQSVPPGTVTFYDSTTNTSLGTATLSAYNNIWSASIYTSSLAVGNHAITATYNGDGSSNYAFSTSAALSLPVRYATSSTLTASPNAAAHGQLATFTAGITPGISGGPAPTGTVTFYDGATALGTGAVSQVGGSYYATFSTSSLSAGSHTITALYGGDGNFASSSAALSYSVNPTSVEVFSDADTAVSTQQVGLSAIVSTTGTGTPTGTVTFFSGSTALGTVNVQSVGGQNLATLPTSSLPLGTDNVTAVYSGDSNFAGSTSPGFDETVTQATTAITLISSTNPVAPGGTLQLIAIANGVAGVNPTGTINFVATNTATEATTTLGPATLSLAGGQALATLNLPNTSLAAGTYTITAEYSGDSNFASGNSSGYTLQVASSSSATVTNLSATVTQAVYGQPQYTVGLDRQREQFVGLSAGHGLVLHGRRHDADRHGNFDGL